MQPSYVQHNYLSFPAEFLKKNQIKDAANVILRVSNGKTWYVKFKYEKSKAILQHGWLAFVKDNCLKVGDVCVFVLVKDINLLFQVEFFRATSCFPRSVLPGHGRGAATQVGNNITSIKVEPDCSMNGGITGMASINPSPLDIGGRNKRSETSGEAAKRRCSSLRVPSVNNVEAANKFFPNNPFFKVSLRAYNIERANVCVPASFIKSCIEGRLEKQRVMLQVENTLWPVNLNPHSKISGLLCRG
ncbi:hypothetical protein ACLB2K_055559 [Fragaria x ananassa]